MHSLNGKEPSRDETRRIHVLEVQETSQDMRKQWTTKLLIPSVWIRETGKVTGGWSIWPKTKQKKDMFHELHGVDAIRRGEVHVNKIKGVRPPFHEGKHVVVCAVVSAKKNGAIWVGNSATFRTLWPARQEIVMAAMALTECFQHH